ncbi:uncharacterized protein LOC122145142 [Cyprinus carpio]|uniref:Uncharacterized protein LOC122145142 n=1 Tax=Cyprinus carpio TaxID=7962 RepID=A0A9R0AVV1_CYPCA|nr:uncharacterized protein LOC122145142 [Cyprinus carpio]
MDTYTAIWWGQKRKTLYTEIPRWRRTHPKSQAAAPDQNVHKGIFLSKALEIVLESIAGDNSEVEDLSDIDNPVEDVDYHPPQQEPSSSEEESSGDEDPTPQSTKASRGRKRLRGVTYAYRSDLSIAKKWTLWMLMHFTNVALANSWLLYRQDHTVRGTPRKGIMQFLEFRMEVAKTYLAQHNNEQEDSTDLSEQENNTDHSEPEKKRTVKEVPHISVRRRANAHLP